MACCQGCLRCMSRIPFATLIATVLCCAGVGIFLGAMYRAVASSLRMFEVVFEYKFYGLSDMRIIFIVVGATMGILSILLLLVGFLATGATRESVYKDWKARLGGRISCAVFMVFTYILELAWLVITGFIAVITFVFLIWYGMCNRLIHEPIPDKKCIDLRQFDFLFPNSTLHHLNICDGKKKEFCKDYVEQAVVMYILALVAAIIVIIGLIHYLMCLSANYAHIKDSKKLLDLQLLQDLQETEMGTLAMSRGGKDRF